MVNNKPLLRFNDFVDSWEYKKLSDVVYKFNNLRVPVSEIKRVPGKIPYYGATGIQDYVEGFTHEGEFVLIAEDGASDLNDYPIKYVKGKIWVNNHAHVICGNSEMLNNYYLSISLKHLNYYKYIVGSSRYKLNSNVLDDINIQFPSLPEQNKIGKLFNNIDTLIENEENKYNKLLDIKKSLLNKMFPKKGEKLPIIRFFKFTDYWEYKKLDEVVQITMGQSPDGSTYSNFPNKYILIQGNADLFNGYVHPRIWTSQITKQCYEGDLIMSVRAPAGSIGKTQYDGVIGRGVAAIKGNEFIYQTLLKMYIDGYWKTISCGSTFDSLNSDDIRNAILSLPSYDEQTKIGKLFSSLDNLANLYTSKISKLKTIKQSLLNVIFI